MKYYKKLRLGASILFLLLIFSASISLFRFTNKSIKIDENSISISGLDDNYEPNNSPTLAYDLSYDKDVWLSNINGLGILEDDDFYKINITMGHHHLKVNLSFSHVLGNIDVEIWNSSPVLLTGSYSMTDDEYIDYVLPSDGIYYILIIGPNSSNTYDLLWKSFLVDDNYEENDHWASAYDITTFMGMKLSSVYGSGIQSDDDFFRIDIASGFEHLTVDLTFVHSTGDINLEVWDNTQVSIAWSNSVDDNEYIKINIPNPGMYYLRIYSGNMGNLYDLWWNATVPVDDWMEENDDFGSSSHVDPKYYSGLKILGIDEDWFQLYLNDGDVIDVRIFFDDYNGNLELELYDPLYTFRDGSYSSDDDEFISFTADISGDWKIRVYHAIGNSVVDYDLDIWIDGETPTGDDGMEENDSYWSAWGLNPNYYADLIVIGNDEDWFQLYLSDGDIIDVRIFFDDYNGNLELELYDPLYTFRDGSYSSDDDEFIMYAADMSGNWRIRVYHGDGNSDVKYDLDIWIQDDYYEFNNHASDLHEGHPSVLVENERTWLSDISGLAVQGDDDWYAIQVTPGFHHLVINVLFNHTLGNIDVSIYDKQGSYISGNFSMSDDEHVDCPLEFPGIFLVKVHGDNARNEYDLWWDDLRTDFRADDAYEMNNDISSAYDLSDSQNMSLLQNMGLGLQYDNDWYEIYIEDGFERLHILLIYDVAEGMIGFKVYDENNDEITGNFTLTDNDYIDYVVPSKGYYYIRIYGDNSGNVYNLLWFAEEDRGFRNLPGYSILILIGSVVGITTIVIKMKRIKLNYK